MFVKSWVNYENFEEIVGGFPDYFQSILKRFEEYEEILSVTFTNFEKNLDDFF